MMTTNDIDWFDGMLVLMDAKVDVADRAAVERVLIGYCGSRPMSATFVDRCIAAAKANLEMDVFDGMRVLLRDKVDLSDRAAVAKAVDPPYQSGSPAYEGYIDWCIKAAKANLAAGGLRRGPYGSSAGFAPPEHDIDKKGRS